LNAKQWTGFGFAGIWMLGTLMMTISATFTGSGFAHMTAAQWLAWVFGGAICPFVPFSMAVYEGSFYALGLAAAGLIAAGIMIDAAKSARKRRS
jgi:hypothetical protein